MSPILDSVTSPCFDGRMADDDTERTPAMTTTPNRFDPELTLAQATTWLEQATDIDWLYDLAGNLAADLAYPDGTKPEDPESDADIELQTEAEEAIFEMAGRMLTVGWESRQWADAMTHSSFYNNEWISGQFACTLPDSGREVTVTVHDAFNGPDVNWSSLGSVSARDALAYADLIQKAALWSQYGDRAQAKKQYEARIAAYQAEKGEQ